MKNISQIEFSAGSGPVSPEYQWQEKISITANEVIFTRSGNGPDSLINTGAWIIPVDHHQIDELFAVLETVDISTIKRFEFEDPIDGGGFENYTISFEKNKIFSISNDTEGETENAQLITGTIQVFIDQLNLPDEALMRVLAE